MSVPRAQDWLGRGGHFPWRPDEPGVDEVQVFHVEAGDADAPRLLLVHGFPTSSVDWYESIDRLAERFRVCALDFPGYGFSDKPRGWGYSLKRDARLLAFYLSEVVGTDTATVFAHDRGDSVALILAGGHAGDGPPLRVEHLFLSNGNIFLPLSNLTTAQRVMLDPSTGPEVVAGLAPSALAEGLGTATFFPPRGADDPAVPATLIWGLNDTVSPPRVANWVWNHHLMLKPGRNSIYYLPDAGHYLQNDRPDALVDAVLHALDAPDDAPGAIDEVPGAPVFVDRSRERIPDA